MRNAASSTLATSTHTNSEFEAPFTVEKQFWRADPYDNQVGEIETSDRGLRYEEYTRSKEVLSCEELDPRA